MREVPNASRIPPRWGLSRLSLLLVVALAFSGPAGSGAIVWRGDGDAPVERRALRGWSHARQAGRGAPGIAERGRALGERSSRQAVAVRCGAVRGTGGVRRAPGRVGCEAPVQERALPPPVAT